jgi:hypothetical protein
MEDTLCRFHHFNDDFLLGQAGNKAKAKANALRTELMKKQKVDKETNAETRMQSNTRRRMIYWRDYISHKLDVSKEIDADFNFPKMQLMSRWVLQIG